MGASCAKTRVASTPSAADNITFRVALLGAPGSGKSAVYRRLIANSFNPAYSPDTKANVGAKGFRMAGPIKYCTAEIWDMPGAGDIDFTAEPYSKLDAAVIVLDGTKPNTFDGVYKYMDALNSVQEKYRSIMSGTESDQEGPPVPTVTPMSPAEPPAERPASGVLGETVPTVVFLTKMDIVEEDIAAYTALHDTASSWGTINRTYVYFTSARRGEGIYEAVKTVLLWAHDGAQYRPYARAKSGSTDMKAPERAASPPPIPGTGR